MRKTRQTPQSAKSKAITRTKKNAIPEVHADMNVLEIIALHPDATGILEAYGLHCVGCAFGGLDTLETGAKSHGLTDDDVENMLTDLRDLLLKAPKKPDVLTLTESAAKALLEIAKGEGKETCLLRVMTDDAGGFCMEFTETVKTDDCTFIAKGVDGAALIADPATLFRVGGSTVDFRDGRFKLDMPTTQASCGCGGNCRCK